VLDDINLNVENGDKIAFVGRNGEGKTTLVRIILNELDYEGFLKLGHNVKVGYFAQNQAQLLNENLTVLETIDEIATGDARTKIRDILGAFLFSGEDVEKKVKVLSGGEKSRLAMIRLLLEPVNLLVLDEPTNHLDMQSKEILKNALIHFSGTIIVVSHDREFLDGMVDCVFEFRNKKIKQHLGGIYEFLQKKKMESLKELEAANKKSQSRNSSDRKAVSNTMDLSFEERKEISKSITRFEKKVENTEDEIEKLETEISEMDEQLSSSEVVNDNSVFKKYDELKASLNETLKRWEREHEELENWKKKKYW
jgi:ATP-binding cassette subfamily F protein 3